MIWCPLCKYKTVLAKFFGDRCPQCGKSILPNEVLRKDPYQPEVGARSGRRGSHPSENKKRFTFDQKRGSDTESTPGSIPSVPTETLNLYKPDK